jgi:hypothetical protein
MLCRSFAEVRKTQMDAFVSTHGAEVSILSASLDAFAEGHVQALEGHQAELESVKVAAAENSQSAMDELRTQINGMLSGFVAKQHAFFTASVAPVRESIARSIESTVSFQSATKQQAGRITASAESFARDEAVARNDFVAM